jgi:addiction module HigA family antidote
MIRSFRCAETERVFQGIRSREFQAIERTALRRLLPHPGETILEDVLKPLDMSVNQMAKHLGITASRLNDIVRGRRGITADTALRLARYLGTSPEVWLGLQLEYDLRLARQKKLKDIERTVRPRSEAA